MNHLSLKLRALHEVASLAAFAWCRAYIICPLTLIAFPPSKNVCVCVWGPDCMDSLLVVLLALSRQKNFDSYLPANHHIGGFAAPSEKPALQLSMLFA